MASYAGAYGAGGASDELHKLLSERFERDKFDEVKRRGKADEDAREKERGDTNEYRRQERESRMQRDESERSERYEDRKERSRQYEGQVQERTTNQMVRAKERADDAAQGLEDREDRQRHDDERDRRNRAFQEHMATAARGPVDDLKRLQVEAEKKKQADAAAASEKQAAQGRETTQSAYDSVSRLLDPKGVGGGLDSSYGNWEMRKGRTQASSDFQAERDRFVAMLALPNLGALKGPMSDKDLLFIKQISSILSNDNISEDAARSEMARARDWLVERGAVPGAGGGAAPQMTRQIRNPMTGETRTQTSLDGGKSWN